MKGHLRHSCGVEDKEQMEENQALGGHSGLGEFLLKNVQTNSVEG